MKSKIKLLTLFTLLTLPLFAMSQDQSGGQGTSGMGGMSSGEQNDSAFAYQEVGQQVYSNNCAACHQASGQGIEGVYPSLAGSALVTEPYEGVIQILLNGRGGMPSFSSDLSNEQIAAVASYIRNAWGNDAEPITPQMVADMTGEVQGSEQGSDSTTRPGAADLTKGRADLSSAMRHAASELNCVSVACL